MPDTPAIDHRVLGIIRRALADVSPRLIEDTTTESEHICFKSLPDGKAYDLVCEESHATTGTRPKPDHAAARPSKALRDVLDAVHAHLASSDLIATAVREGDRVTFSASGEDAKDYTVTAEPQGGKDDASAAADASEDDEPSVPSAAERGGFDAASGHPA